MGLEIGAEVAKMFWLEGDGTSDKIGVPDVVSAVE